MAIQDPDQSKRIAALTQRGVGIGEAMTNQIVKEKDAIGGQLQRFEKLRELSVVNLSESLQESFRSTLSFNERVKFDVGKIADANIRSVEQVMRDQAEQGLQFQTRESKFLQQRILHLTNRLLEADAVEAKVIQGELSTIRDSAKNLAETERKGIEQLADTSSKGLNNISILKSSFMESLPTMEGLVENALGGGFVGKFAGNIIRKRKEVKQRKASLKSELDVESGLSAKDAVLAANTERETFQKEKEAEFEARGDSDPAMAAEMATLEKFGAIEEHASGILKIMEGNQEAQIDSEEEEAEDRRRDERIVEALEDIADREDSEHTDAEENKKSWLDTIMGVVSGFGTFMRFLKNPKAAFRLFRMKLGGLVRGLGKRFTSIFGAKGLLVTKMGAAFSSIGGIISKLGSGVGSVLSTMGGWASSLWNGAKSLISKSGVAGAAKSAGKAVAGSNMGQAVAGAAKKSGGWLSSAWGGIKSAASSVGGAVSGAAKWAGGKVVSGAKAVGGVVSKGAKAVASGAKFVYKGAKNLAGKAAKIVGNMSPVKWLTSKISGKAGGKILSKLAKVPIIAPLIEGLFTAFDISSIANNPEMSEKEKKEAIGQRIGAGLGGALGAIGGGILGSAIPIPGVGTVLGAIAGDFAGRWLGEKLAALVGGENIYDALSFMLPSVKASPEEAMEKADSEALAKAESAASAEVGTTGMTEKELRTQIAEDEEIFGEGNSPWQQDLDDHLAEQSVSASGQSVKPRTKSRSSQNQARKRARRSAQLALQRKTGVVGMAGVSYEYETAEDGSITATATHSPQKQAQAEKIRQQMQGDTPVAPQVVEDSGLSEAELRKQVAEDEEYMGTSPFRAELERRFPKTVAPETMAIQKGTAENRALEGAAASGSTNISNQPVAVQTQNNTSTNILAPQRTRNNDSTHAELSKDRYSPAAI